MTPGQSLADIFLSGLLGGKALMPALAQQIDASIRAAQMRGREEALRAVFVDERVIEASLEYIAEKYDRRVETPACPCARCGQPCDNLQGQYIVAGIAGDICHRCISEEDVIAAVAKGMA